MLRAVIERNPAHGSVAIHGTPGMEYAERSRVQAGAVEVRLSRRVRARRPLGALQALALAMGLAACAKPPPEPVRPALALQRERAAEEGPDQTLEKARLASMLLAEGDTAGAEGVLRQIVVRMQDFRADGQLRATLGAEDRKEWKGDPFEKMMAFLYLGQLLYASGDYGNALAMTKSAILADTGTSRTPYRSDFVPAFVLQALTYDALGEAGNAERSLEQAIDALYLREGTAALGARLDATRLDHDDVPAVEAARVLLLTGLPSGLMAHPRDPHAAIDAARARALELRGLALDGGKADRPEELKGLSRRALNASFDVLESLTTAWHAEVGDGLDLTERLGADEAFLRSLRDGRRLVLFVESGRGPTKWADGRYGEIQRIRSGRDGHVPDVRLDGQPQVPHYLDAVTWQAQTRGSRGVDGFLAGKAMFKDAAPFLGYAAMVAGDIARMSEDAGDSGVVGTVLYIAGAATWVAGALTNPRADTRTWWELPDQLYLVAIDPTPGTHRLTVDGRRYDVDIPDRGTVLHVVPALAPHGAERFGTPCVACDAPLAVPAAEPTPAPGAPVATPNREGGPR